MSAPVNVISVSPKAIRHFAVITIVATLGLAMFAEGENREALEAQLSRKHSQAQLRKAEAEKAKAQGKKLVSSSTPKSQGGWGSDGGAPPTIAIAAPAGSRGAYSDDAEMPARIGETATDPLNGTGPLPPGLREAELERKKKAAKGQEAERKPSQEDIARMVEASRLRSGSGESGGNGDDDAGGGDE